jgi:hypothetical protein
MAKSTSIKPSYGNSCPSAHYILSNSPKKNYVSSLVGTSKEVNVIVGTINTISLIDTGSSVSTVSHSFYIDHFSDLPIHPIKELLTKNKQL